METSKIYIDQQSNPGRKLKYRVRVQFGTGAEREDFDAAYYRTREEAEKSRKTLNRFLKKIKRQHFDQGGQDEKAH